MEQFVQDFELNIGHFKKALEKEKRKLQEIEKELEPIKNRLEEIENELLAIKREIKENEARIHSMNFANFRATRPRELGDIRAEIIQGKRIQDKLESYAKRHRISYKKVGSNLREEDSLLELIEVNF